MPASSFQKSMSKQIYVKSAALCCPETSLLDAFELTSSPVDNTLIPANIRRRTSLTTRIAITAATLACQRAKTQIETIPSVFASMGGEIQVTDTLCRLLPDSEALLSPTQFHNSVHNTTAGYWSILNRCQAQTTAIAAADDTFAMGLLEAWVQLQFSPGDLLLVCYDENWPQYLAPPIGTHALACAIVLSSDDSHALASMTMPQLNSAHSPHEPTVSPQLWHESWSKLVDTVPAAATIPLLLAINNSPGRTEVPLNTRTAIWFTHCETKTYA